MGGLTRSSRGYVLDASVLVDLLAGGERSHAFVEEIIDEGVGLYAVRFNIVEALYVACRLWGVNEALEGFSFSSTRGCLNSSITGTYFPA